MASVYSSTAALYLPLLNKLLPLALRLSACSRCKNVGAMSAGPGAANEGLLAAAALLDPQQFHQLPMLLSNAAPRATRAYVLLDDRMRYNCV